MSIYSSTTTIPDLDSYEGRTGKLSFDDLSFSVKIIKARLRFGHLDLLVSPATGEGERWVEQHRVSLDELVADYGLIEDKRQDRFFTTDLGELKDFASEHPSGIRI